MRRHLWLVIAALVLLAVWAWTPRPTERVPAPARPTPVATPEVTRAPAPTSPQTSPADTRYPAFLPREAHEVVRRIERGGPFEYRQDGGEFGNRERRLPLQPRGYYHEYTVPTPGSPDRGARRIVTGGGIPGTSPPREYWYTADHYRSFRRFELQAVPTQ